MDVEWEQNCGGFLQKCPSRFNLTLARKLCNCYRQQKEQKPDGKKQHWCLRERIRISVMNFERSSSKMEGIP